MGNYDQDDGLTKFLEQAAGHKLLSAHEEQTLSRRWLSEGDERARHELMMHNLRLVISIARNFTGRGLPLADLIQAGVIGLDRATRKFDPERGFKFSTYASWWIRQAVQRSVSSEGKTIRVPNQVFTRGLQISTALRENPELTREELAAKLECTVAQVLQAQRAAEVVASLDREHPSATQTLLDTLPNTDSDDPAELIQSDPREVSEALGRLTPLQRSVIERRFGIGTGIELSFDEIARELDVTVQVAQTASREAFTRLREFMLN